MNGKILKNRYKIISELGKGGFGTTYLAVDLDLPNHPQCVVKQLAPSDPRPQVFQVAKNLFEKEAVTLQPLGEHHLIPRLFAYFEEAGKFYLVQEFIAGNDLTTEIYPGKKFTENQTVKLLIEILSVLKYVHQQNVIHRDLKPQNIMRRKSDGKIVLIDFGAVKEIKGLTVTSGGQTTTTIAIGTPGYMPSEQAAGKPKFCSDIYAVGMIGIEALSGIKPSKLKKDQSTDEIIWKNQVNISDKLELVIDKMVSDYWRNRYQSIDEVMDKLQGVNNYSGNSSTLNPTLVSNPQPTPDQSLAKIGLGIGLGVIFASVIIANFSRKKETLSLSSTTNNQNEEALFKPSPTTSLSKTTESSISVSDPWYSAVISAQTAAQKALTAQTKSEWDAVASDWQKAINLMKEVQESDPNYQKTKDRIPVYQNNLNVAKQRAAQAPIQEIPSPSPSPTINSEVNESELNADYSKLEQLLRERKWKQADRETEKIMLQVTDRTSEAWLDPVSISKFPCSDLRKIDQLWIEKSNRHFGFTVQKPIYLETGNQPRNFQEEPYKLFGKTVGWYQNDNWLKYDQLNFNFPGNAPKGHLPAPHRERTSSGFAPYHYLMEKMIKCNL